MSELPSLPEMENTEELKVLAENYRKAYEDLQEAEKKLDEVQKLYKSATDAYMKKLEENQ